jgi:glycosyltransferase involved in cell wall biosynthesis
MVPFSRVSFSPVADMLTVPRLARAIREIKPDIFFAYAIKPSIYGLLAARLAGVRRRTAMITGAGYAFVEGRELRRRIARLVVEALCRISLHHADRLIFQNRDDEKLFVERGLIDSAKTAVVDGSGVDLAHFAVAPQPSKPLTFLLIARLIGDKGVYEYAEAARRVKHVHPDVRFLLLGRLDPHPAAIRESEIRAWERDGILTWLGSTNDVRPVIARSHVLVLPSFNREGIPRSLLEALSMARAVITTDAPGCREPVQQGANGLLVPIRDASALTTAMLRFCADPLLASRMGARGRRIAEARFDVNLVNADMLAYITSKNTAAATPASSQATLVTAP